MAMIAKLASGEPSSEINITPLIDVMLVLLTMLIVTLPIQTHVVKIDMPARSEVRPPPVVVALNIDFDGTMFWNGEVVDRAALDARFAHAAHMAAQPEIQVHADRLARYDGVAKVLADAQRLGVTKIGIIGTEEDTTPSNLKTL